MSEVGDLTPAMRRMAWLGRNEEEKRDPVDVPYLIAPSQFSVSLKGVGWYLIMSSERLMKT